MVVIFDCYFVRRNMMDGWKKFCNEAVRESNAENLMKLANDNFDEFNVYPRSVNIVDGSLFFIARTCSGKSLVIFGDSCRFSDFEGETQELSGRKVKICPMNVHNSRVLREIFPFTAPVSHRGTDITIGLGDRLGMASPGHIRLVRDLPVFPVLAQQSIRELNLTGRTYDDVLAAASWAVFQEGYRKGFGADGDHLKTAGEVRMAIDKGFTMITLDCSEHIDNKVVSLSESEVEQKYAEIPEKDRKALEEKYLGREFHVGDGFTIKFDAPEFKRTVLVYWKAIKYTIDIYNNIIKTCGRSIDFEMSIDETLTSTTPASHFLVASELIAGGVEITSLAPRFCGEFQKGIDYMGDIEQFRLEFSQHVKIAEHFGYKISVHSGSDKFSVFPIVGSVTRGKYHLKTAGTNWLEAVRIIAEKNPALFRRMHKFALENLAEARKYYHISADTGKIPDIDGMEDSELPKLLDMDDSRQVLHITYGLILQEKDSSGAYTFRDEFFDTLSKYENEYYEALRRHIGRHLKELGIAVK